jgi:hypothetical protein
MKKVQAKPLSGSLSQTEVVALAVFLLGGDEHAVDTEDVAVKAHDLAPGRFAWRKYPEQINLELVRVYLSDAKKPQRGALIDGSGRTGWVLTRSGQRWARQAASRLAGADLSRPRTDSRAGSIDETRWRRERSRILSTAAWAQWSQGVQKIPAREIEEVFRIDAYAVGQLRQTKITRLIALFKNDDDMAPFLRHTAAVLESAGGKT